MFKPVLTVLGMFILGLPTGAEAAYTSGSVALVCPTSSYPYSAISNATMSGSCTGYTGTSGGACSGSSATRYSGFTCNSGYTKSGSTCLKKLSTGCSSCCTSLKPYCYNNTCYTTCLLTNGTQCLMCATSPELEVIN